ncbi:hypothetical protein HOLleu_12325 [Holothuria leucospilota]|uniref:Uncharacterized protein n=1 Tax=Holothuria leucospilota TaxID=206669 RepID=A0A9Q1CB68_HOLLE|nr:hypothetical protein HOLleu_12325 [Holothuria leucospilota]
MAAIVKLADSFLEAHGGLGTLSESNKKKSTQQSNEVSKSNRTPRHDKFGKGKDIKSENQNKRTCFVCGKTGHFARDCNRWKTVNKLAAMQLDNQDVALEETKGENVNIDTTACMIVLPDKEVLKKNENGFINLSNETKVPVLSAACSSKGTRRLPVTEGLVGDKKVSVLRDTGCTGVVVRKDFVKSHQFTGETVCCILIDRTVHWLPVAVIRIDTKFIKGEVRAICMENPIYDLIVGNISNCEQQVQEGKVSEGCDSNMGMAENIDANVVSADETRAQKLAKQKPFRELKIPKKTLQVAQTNDDTLVKVRKAAESGVQNVGKNGSISRFFYENGILYRNFCSPRVEHGNEFRQLVVPAKFRSQVMELAHESLLGGHLGSKKTVDRVLAHFFWPGIQADIIRFCRSCNVCQRTLPKGKVTKVPLGTMPVIEMPFERVAVDIIGPIQPATERGNRYILTVMDYATRYPEAIALPSIEAERVAEALVEIYTRVSIRREILTDQGTQFTSEVMQQVSKLLSIRQLTTTQYHPACNGLVECFNGTLKQMLKRTCAERPRDWD